MIGQLHADKLLDSAFMICKIINASVRVISLAFGSRLFVIHQRILVVYLTLCDQAFKDAVKCILRIGSAHSKGGEL